MSGWIYWKVYGFFIARTICTMLGLNEIVLRTFTAGSVEMDFN